MLGIYKKLSLNEIKSCSVSVIEIYQIASLQMNFCFKEEIRTCIAVLS